MSHTLDGEHTQAVWLTDDEVDLVIEAIGYFLTADENWIGEATRRKFAALLRRLEEGNW